MTLNNVTPEMKEAMANLDAEIFKQHYGELFQDLTNIQANGKVDNVTRTSIGEWRCVVYKDHAIKDVFVEEGNWTSYQELEEGDEILWVAVYADGRRFIVYNKVGTEGYEIVEHGNINEYYKGEDGDYLVSFIAGIGSKNNILKDEEVMKLYTDVANTVKQFVPKDNHEVTTFVSAVLISAKDVENFKDLTWSTANKFDEGDEVTYGVTFETDSEKIVNFKNRRLIVWEANKFLDTDGNENIDDSKLVNTSYVVNEAALTALHPNSKGSHQNTMKIPDNWKGFIAITINEAEGFVLEELALFAKDGFTPMD